MLKNLLCNHRLFSILPLVNFWQSLFHITFSAIGYYNRYYPSVASNTDVKMS